MLSKITLKVTCCFSYPKLHYIMNIKPTYATWRFKRTINQDRASLTEDCFRYEDSGQLTNWQILEPFSATVTTTTMTTMTAMTTTTIQKARSAMLALKNVEILKAETFLLEDEVFIRNIFWNLNHFATTLILNIIWLKPMWFLLKYI